MPDRENRYPPPPDPDPLADPGMDVYKTTWPVWLVFGLVFGAALAGEIWFYVQYCRP